MKKTTKWEWKWKKRELILADFHILKGPGEEWEVLDLADHDHHLEVEECLRDFEVLLDRTAFAECLLA
jgi:hypothetical protein